MCCVLKAYGKQFAVDLFLTDGPLKPVNIFYSGRTHPFKQGKKHSDSGCAFLISKGFGRLDRHVLAAIKFLRRHREEIARLVQFSGVTVAYLDFGYDRRSGVVVQCDQLPKELIALAGALGLGIGLSLYSPSTPKPRKLRPQRAVAS